MVGDTIVMSIELVGGTTLVLTIGALTAAAGRLRAWISNRNPEGLAPVEEAAQPIAQVHADIDPYRDAAGESLLAQGLSISRNQLQMARKQAHGKILSHLLNEGIITVDEARHREAEGYALSGPYSSAMGTLEPSGDEAAFLAYLAEGLEISLAELQEARESALERALTIAVEEGIMTEEQMADRLMRYRAQPYMDPAGLLAESLDITLEELEDRSLNDWLIARKLTWRALIARLTAAREDALTQALIDGELDRADVDRLLAEATWAPLLGGSALQVTTQRLPQYGFFYLHNTDGILN